MNSFVQMIGFFALSFLGSLSLAWIIVRLRMRCRRVVLQPGAVLRLRCSEGMYRSSLLADTGRGLVLSAPLQRDSYVALRTGERLVVEAADERGAYLFRSEVVDRELSSHQIVIRRPAMFSRIERRESGRVRKGHLLEAALDGEKARVLDLSELGARVATRARVSRGERVRLDLQGREEPIFGWVLECMPGSALGYESAEVRVRFEQTLEGLPA